MYFSLIFGGVAVEFQGLIKAYQLRMDSLIQKFFLQFYGKFSIFRIIPKKVSFIPYFYSESFRDKEMIIKRFYYLMGKYLSTLHLFLIPGFTLVGIKEGSGKN